MAQHRRAKSSGQDLVVSHLKNKGHLKTAMFMLEKKYGLEEEENKHLFLNRKKPSLNREGLGYQLAEGFMIFHAKHHMMTRMIHPLIMQSKIYLH